MEIWKKIDGFENYSVSSEGRVRNDSSNYVLKGWINGRGYKSVYIGKSVSVHSLVCLSFVGPRPFGLTIDHIDGNKLNNNFSNLRYLTNLENVRLGRCKSVRITKNSESLLFDSLTEAAEYIGSSKGLLSGQAKKGKLVKGWQITYG